MLVLYPFKNALWALRPAKPLGVLSRHPCRNPKPLPRGEGLCMLCWLCIVQSLWAYTPGIRAGAECGAAALTPLGATPQTPEVWFQRMLCSYQKSLFSLNAVTVYAIFGTNSGSTAVTGLMILKNISTPRIINVPIYLAP